VILLVRMGVVSVEQLIEARPYVIVGAFVVAAVLTPPDVISQLLLAFPLWILYELGIVAARVLGVTPQMPEAEPATGPATEPPTDTPPKQD
jgi:sec-independent protein translocase protein TatC